MKPLLVITRGIPGSGKSFWAEETAATIEKQYGVTVASVCMDDLRGVLFRNKGVGDRPFSRHEESVVKEARAAAINTALAKGFSVISHDTNCSPGFINNSVSVYRDTADVIVADFSPVPFKTCAMRNAHRERSVPFGILISMSESLAKRIDEVRGAEVYTPEDAAAALGGWAEKLKEG